MTFISPRRIGSSSPPGRISITINQTGVTVFSMKIIVQNLATEYQDEGSDPVMLFLHGWQDSSRTFDALASHLSQGWRVIRLDLPGFGQTEMPPIAWNLSDYVEFVAAFIGKLNLHIAVLVGHSFGGRIAIKGIAENHLHVDKVVLIASAGVTPRKSIRNIFLAMGTLVGRAVIALPPFCFWREGLRQKLYRLIGSDYANAGALSDIFVRIIAEDLSAQARLLDIPTLLIWGAHDTETPLADGQRLTSLIRGSVLRVIDDAGHFVHKKKSREVAQIIQKFL